MEHEPTIFKAAKDKQELGEASIRAKERIAQLLDGELSETKKVLGQHDGVSYVVELRRENRYRETSGVGFSYKTLTRAFVFDGDEGFKFDMTVEDVIRSGPHAWRSKSTEYNQLDLTDIGHVNEVLDLFEQNVGKGVNRD